MADMNFLTIFSAAVFASVFQCSDTVKAKARDFIDNERQFHPGVLPTEQSNPTTASLEEDFRRSTFAAGEWIESQDWTGKETTCAVQTALGRLGKCAGM